MHYIYEVCWALPDLINLTHKVNWRNVHFTSGPRIVKARSDIIYIKVEYFWTRLYLLLGYIFINVRKCKPQKIYRTFSRPFNGNFINAPLRSTISAS